MTRLRAAIAPVVAGLGLLLALAMWAFSSPVGSAPDDTYHLPTIWCSWGEHERCQRDGEGSFQAPQVVSEVCTYQRSQVSASCEYLRTDQPVTVGHLRYVGSDAQLQGNAVFHRVLRVFVGPDAEQSALNMRLFNVGLAAVLFTWALLASSSGARRALALSWLVASVPVGMFIMSSTNPSAWAIAGVGTFWAFLLAAVRSSGTHRVVASAGALVSGVIAAGARADSLVFIGGSTLAVALIVWPRIRRQRAVLIGLAILAGVIAVLMASTSVRNRIQVVLQGFGGTEGTDPRLIAGGVNPTVNHLLELPSYLWALIGGQGPTFAFPTAYLRGLGWLDTSVPSITGIFMLIAVIVVVTWGLGTYSARKIAAIAVAFVVLVGAVLIPLEGVNYAPTFVTQPRYVLPMLYVVIALAALRPARSGRPRLVLVVLIVVLAVVANAAAHLTSLHRYTNGEALPWMRPDMEPSWWWLGAPVGPTTVWLIGALGFLVFAIAVASIARGDGLRGITAKEPFQGVEADHIR